MVLLFSAAPAPKAPERLGSFTARKGWLMATRFQLEDATIYSFRGEFFVVCPRCRRRALVRDRGRAADPRVSLTCGGCGLSRTFEHNVNTTTFSPDASHYEAGEVGIGDAVDWYFHLPLWLQTPCCSHTLWAYNLEHLAFLEDFVQATLRENVRDKSGWSNQSLRNRLPAWIKDGHSREAILRCVGKLRQKAAE